MTDIQVFFNRPGTPAGISEAILADIRAAKDYLFVASAWFTDDRIATALLESRCKAVVIVLNEADINKPGAHKTASMLIDESIKAKDQGHRNFFVGVLGWPEEREGLMHHKYVVADDVVWTGSFNLTYRANSNYENAVRIHDAAIAKQFSDETIALIDICISRYGDEE